MPLVPRVRRRVFVAAAVAVMATAVTAFASPAAAADTDYFDQCPALILYGSRGSGEPGPNDPPPPGQPDRHGLGLGIWEPYVALAATRPAGEVGYVANDYPAVDPVDAIPVAYAEGVSCIGSFPSRNRATFRLSAAGSPPGTSATLRAVVDTSTQVASIAVLGPTGSTTWTPELPLGSRPRYQIYWNNTSSSTNTCPPPADRSCRPDGAGSVASDEFCGCGRSRLV